MNIRILEMPLDFGASRHGSDMGPSAIRLAGIKERLESLGHKTVRYFSPMQINPQEYESVGNPKAKYLGPIVRANTQLAEEVEKAALEGDFPLILGGDHSIALGSVAGLSAAYQKKGLRFGVLYVDAHGDFNTDETSPSGNIHGECMSANCGYGLPDLTNLYFEGRKVDPRNVCYVGLRSIDEGERKLMKEAGVTVYTMTDIDRHGFNEVVRHVLRFFKRKVDAVHVSFDMDCLDPMYAPGTGYHLPAGMSNREALLLMEEMYDLGLVRSAEIVEVNPVLDVRNQTAAFAVELVARLLGEKIF
ncbi:arginase [uncultured Treponema sp.]|uniref:arginase n=1 Tax=uncultured Treponema sp. TaxID=162155 RepID=UPI0025F83ACA|nr:arginase [uncultured Treponema sp.]